jgi:anti-anti-sigma regulatory factor
MPFSMTSREGRQILTLEGEVTIRNARELAAMVGESLEDAIPVEVDVSQLTGIDTCILQFLCSLRKTVRNLTFGNQPPAFVTKVDRIQLRRALLGEQEL